MIPSIVDAGEALRRGDATSVELTQAALKAADAYDAQLETYITRFDEQALSAARQADQELAQGIDRGPLHGIPIAIKDNISTVEAPTTAQSRVSPPGLAHAPDADVVTLLREGGAVILGKTTLMEYGIGLPEPTETSRAPRNPWNDGLWAGGSSSGTANGVAAGLFFGGLGTDTGGSIRIPAAYCGITGFKPTYGLVPLEGAAPLGFSLDTIGPLARSAKECRLLFEHMIPETSRDRLLGARNESHTSDTPLAGLRLAIDRRVASTAEDQSSGSLVQLLEATVTEFERLGATVSDINVPLYDELTTATMISELAEAFAYHRTNLIENWEGFNASTRMIITSGALITGPDYVQAQRVRKAGIDLIAAEIFSSFDAVLMPTVSAPAPDLPLDSLDDILAASHTAYWNATGHPIVSFPIGLNTDNLPMSMQIVGNFETDRDILRVVEAYQEATRWHTLLPVVHAGAAWGDMGISSDQLKGNRRHE